MKRVALITGGTGGIGEATCLALSDAGHAVAVTYPPSNNDYVAGWLSNMKNKGCNTYAYELDITDYDACRTNVAKIQREIGPIDILINNAGITRDMTFAKMEKDDWDLVLRTNLDSVFNMTKQVIGQMIANGWGRIISISSVNGSKGSIGQTNYSAAKAGMYGFTKSLALEVAKKGITVNTISPGFTATRMVTAIPSEILETKIIPQIPMGRLGKPEEIAKLIAYLCSNDAAFITGANIAINGGQHMY